MINRLSLVVVYVLSLTIIWGTTDLDPDPESSFSSGPCSSSLDDNTHLHDLLQEISERLDNDVVRSFLESIRTIHQNTKPDVVLALYNRIFHCSRFDSLLPLAVQLFTDLIDGRPDYTHLMDSVTIQMVLGLFDQLQDHFVFVGSPSNEIALLRRLSDRAQSSSLSKSVDSVMRFSMNRLKLYSELPRLIDDEDNLVPDHIIDILRNIPTSHRTPPGILQIFIDGNHQDLLLSEETLVALLRCGCRLRLWDFITHVNVPESKLSVIYPFLTNMQLESAYFQGRLHPWFIDALVRMFNEGYRKQASDLTRLPLVEDHLRFVCNLSTYHTY